MSVPPSSSSSAPPPPSPPPAGRGRRAPLVKRFGQSRDAGPKVRQPRQVCPVKRKTESGPTAVACAQGRASPTVLETGSDDWLRGTDRDAPTSLADPCHPQPILAVPAEDDFEDYSSSRRSTSEVLPHPQTGAEGCQKSDSQAWVCCETGPGVLEKDKAVVVRTPSLEMLRSMLLVGSGGSYLAIFAGSISTSSHRPHLHKKHRSGAHFLM